MPVDQNVYQWRFFRAGGFDQVLLTTENDLLNLAGLDKKLWSALSCPVKGVEFDQRTLELIDTDGDGHIRVPEILAAIGWAAECLADRSLLVSGSEGVPLAAISRESDDGGRVLNSARTILSNLGRPDAVRITVEDAAAMEQLLSGTRFNGDGVVTVLSTDHEMHKGWIADIMACLGSETDRSGEQGITGEILDRFSTETAGWLQWNAESLSDGAGALAQSAREDAMVLWQEVRPKVDDYFLRCGMAAYDTRAAALMNGGEECLTALAALNLSDAATDMAQLPLSAVSAEGVLHLVQGLNPAWLDRIAALKSSVIVPVLGEVTTLSAGAWSDLKETVSCYEAWWSRKPDTPVSALGTERLQEWSGNGIDSALRQLIEQDLALQPEFDAIVNVERLTRYCRDLLPLANNFVSFRDFYTKRGKAIFQSGTLYLDGRSFDLCITVTDIAKHALLANLSRVYLVYCDCIRNGGAEKMTVAAAVTNGDSDQLLVGRNGVFFDRQGVDWDATVVRIVEHPISLRQAFWAPYKRIGKAVGEQLQKLAAAKSKAAEDKAAAGLMQTGQKPADGKPPQPAFDVGKFAGIFAAIGLAVGAIGTALASILTGFFKLAWWQMPLALLGIMLLISGPSIIIAWFKLRHRNLGRLLDANGWAVNTRACINIPFGASLTSLSRLPQGAVRELADPFEEKKNSWKFWLMLFLLLAAVVAWKAGFLPIK